MENLLLLGVPVLKHITVGRDDIAGRTLEQSSIVNHYKLIDFLMRIKKGFLKK